MGATSSERTIMSTRPLKTAIVYDFYLFLQLFVFVLFVSTTGRLLYAIDRLVRRPVMTPWIMKTLESLAVVAVIKK